MNKKKNADRQLVGVLFCFIVNNNGEKVGTFLRLVPRVVEISGVAGISGRIAFDGHGGVLVRGLSSRRDMKVP